MWLGGDEIFELLRGYFPYYLVIALPVFIIISPVNPVAGAHEFPVYRMQQYDLHGLPHGCRSAPVNLEARSVSGWRSSRHCVVTRLGDLTTSQFREIQGKAGALLIVLPQRVALLSNELKQQILELEVEMMREEVSVPVYFAEWSQYLEDIVRDVSSSYAVDDHSTSAVQVLLSCVSANGYQIVVNTNQAVPRPESSVATVQGKLSGYGVEEKLPTIAITAHYDSFGVAPELSFGADSNGSGIAMLLELARVLSHLYSNPTTHARYNIIFLLTGAGKLNYQGSKRWLEDQLDGLESSLVQDAVYVLCLDTLGSGDSLYLHVSKPPREGSPGSVLLKELKSSAATLFPTVAVEGLHKKINLAEEVLAWEHERYSIRRLPAFTLSSLKSHKDSIRSSILDVPERVSVSNLARNTQIVAEALAHHIYNLSLGEMFSTNLGIETESLQAWMEFLTSKPRSAQLLAWRQSPFVNVMRDAMSRYLKEVKVAFQTPDKRDPEFVFYDVTKAVVNVYSVKPAVFDLFLTIAIVFYLGSVYLIIQHFPALYGVVSGFIAASKG